MQRKREQGLKNCIRELRATTLGLTQQDLADRVGVTGQTIVAMEGAIIRRRLRLPYELPGCLMSPLRRCSSLKSRERFLSLIGEGAR